MDLIDIEAVRKNAQEINEIAKKNELTYFDVDMTKWADVVDAVAATITRDYTDYSQIPPHGRWQHFNVGKVDRVGDLIGKLHGSDLEKAKSLWDLFFVSVLLDAGAGNQWSYKSKQGADVSRSEGLAVASIEMFEGGLFSSSKYSYQADTEALSALTVAELGLGLQISDHNPIEGLVGRTTVLNQLGSSLKSLGFERPSCILDKLISSNSTKLSVAELWSELQTVLLPAWPDRVVVDGVKVGDAWPCEALAKYRGVPLGHHDSIAPFHKLTQWLTYSLLPIPKTLLQSEWTGEELLTGLPEYRNGGLLVDLGLLKLKPNDSVSITEGNGTPVFPATDPVIVEWRACTVGFLDNLLPELRAKLNYHLSLAQMLEAGTWLTGRELAKEKRQNGAPPIAIISDGTLF
ncbi:hypothetical protein CANCADRAFT_25609 [Tortispora caseinolytica NRRL Y-17796]|uniref:Uracil catabolism protein 4 n=1 Tax=Tortispora caseinolytica NRRL Y-17796 TaxID=767744 RepID=A0A1E4TG40_9ASCO|nr:hypothetical protein CANCADRAFT_25609 [Tortispora caseinolytica NRRL Y-17796]